VKLQKNKKSQDDVNLGFGLKRYRMRYRQVEGLLTEALVDKIVECVSIRREGELLLWVTRLGRRALVEALDGDGAKISTVRRLLRQHRRPLRHHAINESHHGATGTAARTAVDTSTV
jgi:hypothetical protein